MPYYREIISPLLPSAVLDFHTHSWKRGQRLDIGASEGEVVQSSKNSHEKYMVIDADYAFQALNDDIQRAFPDKDYRAVVFGQPTPAADVRMTNAYIAGNAASSSHYPLRVTGKNLADKDAIRADILENGYFGYKVYLNWVGDDYGQVLVEEMIGPEEMELANELGLIVLLHVPRSGRLADPEVARGVRDYALACPNAKIVLAHCGRCYLPSEMKEAIGAIADLPNVFVDTAMVMDATVLQMAFEHIGPERVLYATDFPVAAMRGRRVRVMDHWVDLVFEGYPASAYRVASNNMRASFMAYEIVLAIQTGGEMAGISDDSICSVFRENGMALLESVMGGQQMRRRAASGSAAR